MALTRRRIGAALIALIVALPISTGSMAAIAAPISGDGWSWPVSGQRGVIAPFRAPMHDYGPGHRGMDIRASAGDQVLAPADGVIAFRGTVVDRPLLTLETDDGYVLTFEPVESAHLPGERITAGQALGVVASGGHSASGSMHVGARLNGDYVNPLPLFGSVPRAILLPCC